MNLALLQGRNDSLLLGRVELHRWGCKQGARVERHFSDHCPDQLVKEPLLHSEINRPPTAEARVSAQSARWHGPHRLLYNVHCCRS